ncbi:ADP-ribosylglycohydrolase family protein [Anaeromassilibacillus sp. D41t1_190614_C2]|uniref:ADP-ribosylglycohydrolase family protein n=1 Tax=Anaeromassilibacillus sp. D41t1_190614_C2 TaxID=2787078 RepID=UPI0018A0ED90|nr:ADP-ribosylglycohydrolase family protein [Anaeromassilibacillus sp. D41t1_190614_C2]HJB49901.1 ADP-ribosylglycohydrolase family protein [Candidatus Anaeromassilibacillus stercoravium]
MEFPHIQITPLQRVEGAILGFAVGDALGVPAEFMSRDELARTPIKDMRGGGAHGQPAGTWSDDTSMTLCMMDSFMEKGVDYEDQMLRFSDWLWNAANTAHDEVFDVGGTTKHAIFAFCKGAPPLECGETAEFCCGNGSLMRILPAALYLIGTYKTSELDDRSALIVHNISKCTHAHPRCLMACGVYCAVVFQLYRGGHLRDAVKAGVLSALSYYKQKSEFADVYPEFELLKDIDLWPEEQIRGSGYVIHTLQAALWCLLKTPSYQDCMLTAIRLGEDTDTTAAVAGGLSGLWYGVQAIPNHWLEKLAKCGGLKWKSKAFFNHCFGNVEGSNG